LSPQKACLVAGALFGVTGVCLGAWGAHGLSAYLNGDTGAWDTAVLYQLIHALALLVIGGLLNPAAVPTCARWLNVGGYLMMVGVLLFSGSIYLLTLGGPRWLGPVTPFGGLCFIAAWTLLAVAAWRWPGR